MIIALGVSMPSYADSHPQIGLWISKDHKIYYWRNKIKIKVKLVDADVNIYVVKLKSPAEIWENGELGTLEATTNPDKHEPVKISNFAIIVTDMADNVLIAKKKYILTATYNGAFKWLYPDLCQITAANNSSSNEQKCDDTFTIDNL